MYAPDNYDQFEAHEAEEARLERIYAEEEFAFEIADKRWEERLDDF